MKRVCEQICFLRELRHVTHISNVGHRYVYQKTTEIRHEPSHKNRG